MLPEERFLGKDCSFWAHVKFLSEQLDYSNKIAKEIGTNPPVSVDEIARIQPMRRYSSDEILNCFQRYKLNVDHLYNVEAKSLTTFAQLLLDYLNSRADMIETKILPFLMNRDEAQQEFERIRQRVNPQCPLPMNKQKGEKRHFAFLTCIVNMLTEEALGELNFDGNPQALPVIINQGRLLRTLSRRMDGAYPSVINPYAVWEVKEYYGTTTFGSRVADGIYETALDGKELAEIHSSLGVKIYHYLMIDDRFTWWMGRSYLCRIIDLLHMGLVDEVLFGKEVIIRWPQIVRTWPRTITRLRGVDHLPSHPP